MTKKSNPAFKFTDEVKAEARGLTVEEYRRLESKEEAVEVKKESKINEQLKLNDLKKQLHSKKYTTPTISGLVETSEIKSIGDLMEAVEDQIFSLEETIAYSDINEEFGWSERSAKAYINKLKNFLTDNRNNVSE